MDDVLAWLHDHVPNATLPPWFPTHRIEGQCNGTSSLAAEGLYPVKFGGLSRYFAILACYMLGFMAVAFAVVRRTCKHYDRQ